MSGFEDETADQARKLPIARRTWRPARRGKQGVWPTGSEKKRSRVGDVATNFKGAIDKSLKQQPMATLAAVAMLGFVLGALWKS